MARIRWTGQFPHGVLEVKLQLQGDQQTPAWVNDLLESGLLTEVRARPLPFSRGCAFALTSRYGLLDGRNARHGARY